MSDHEIIILLSAIITELDYLTGLHEKEANTKLLKIKINRGVKNEINRINPNLMIFRAWCSLKSEFSTVKKIDLLIKKQ